VEAKRGRTFQVAQDTFNSSPIGLSRSMHKLTDPIYSITDVWSSKREILKSTNNLSGLVIVGLTTKLKVSK
jgi:hypothetical protein